MVEEERVSVLVIGGGGREHSLCYALKRSHSCDAVFCAPGNAGISNSGDATCIEDLNISDSSAVIAFCRKWEIGLVVVGPEAPLVAGLTNDLLKAGIHAFGPSSQAAALEGSKNFMKSLCHKYGIPTAKVRLFFIVIHIPLIRFHPWMVILRGRKCEGWAESKVKMDNFLYSNTFVHKFNLFIYLLQ